MRTRSLTTLFEKQKKTAANAYTPKLDNIQES